MKFLCCAAQRMHECDFYSVLYRNSTLPCSSTVAFKSPSDRDGPGRVRNLEKMIDTNRLDKCFASVNCIVEGLSLPGIILYAFFHSLRCDNKLFSILLIKQHFCLLHSCMKLAIRWFSGTDRETYETTTTCAETEYCNCKQNSGNG